MTLENDTGTLDNLWGKEEETRFENNYFCLILFSPSLNFDIFEKLIRN